MTRYQLLIAATAVVASVGITACDGQNPSSPMDPSTSASSAASLSRSPSRDSRRSVLRVTKDCTAGSTCTITSSTFNGIRRGSIISYASGPDANGWLDSDIVIDPPGRSRHKVFGHCSVDLATGDGECTLKGGTGKFEEFSATVVVSHLDGPNYAWEGTYRLSSKRD